MWECIDYVAAKQTLRNRPAGMIKARLYNIDGLHYKSLILDKVLPAIVSKCPLGMKSKVIYIQHDNAPPHKSVFSSCPELVEKITELGVLVMIREQLPNSPDLNVLDLGVFELCRAVNFKMLQRMSMN